MVTLEQIAKLAGVSRGTVDRALNNRGDVRPEVARTIREIADWLGYTPNRAGKALATRKNPLTIGVILNSAGNPFFAPMLDGIREAEREYADFGLRVLVREIGGYNARLQAAEIDSLVGVGIGALVIMPINAPLIREKLRLDIPVITLNSDLDDCGRLAYVGCHYVHSGETAAQLLGLFTGGHACVGIVTGSIRLLGHTQRVSGFISACRRDYPDVRVADVLENNDDDDISYQAVSALLSSHPQVDALYFGAAGVDGGLRAVDEACRAGRRQPLVLCCDETETIRAAILDGRVQATVCQQPFEQGYRAVCAAFNAAVNHKTPVCDRLYTENVIKIKYNL